MIEELHDDLSAEVESVRVVSEQEFSKTSHCGKALWRSAANWQPSHQLAVEEVHRHVPGDEDRSPQRHDQQPGREPAK